MIIEYRTVALADFDLKGRQFRGKVAVFGEPWAADLTAQHGYEEVVMPGSFLPALEATPNVPFLREHDQGRLLATTRSGRLALREDGRAFVAEATLPDTALGAETRELIESGDLHGMSYGARSERSGSRIQRVDGIVRRAVHAFHSMIDVSITWDPAYPSTDVELRTAGHAAATLGELEGTETDDQPDEGQPVLSDQSARIRGVIIADLTKPKEWDCAT